MPFIAWSLTAVFFLVRPRYEQAYETLAVRTYPLADHTAFAVDPSWQELKLLRTILGEHLLVRLDGRWRQLDPVARQPRAHPDENDLKRLVEDAFVANPVRYGHIAAIDGDRITTTTGVDVTFDWDTFTLSQQGTDTRWINRIYDIHYLKWTGIAALDKVLGVSGLLLLLYMTWTGAQLALGGRTRNGN
ncbi:MAG TPA: hypothetical protein VMH83_03665 [Candidatus Acidoferrum sp.]|nr:hypothetical protein [Candidatus Acidoferrum sp.]